MKVFFCSLRPKDMERRRGLIRGRIRQAIHNLRTKNVHTYDTAVPLLLLSYLLVAYARSEEAYQRHSWLVFHGDPLLA